MWLKQRTNDSTNFERLEWASTAIRLIGRMRREHLDELKAPMALQRPTRVGRPESHSGSTNWSLRVRQSGTNTPTSARPWDRRRKKLESQDGVDSKPDRCFTGHAGCLLKAERTSMQEQRVHQLNRSGAAKCLAPSLDGGYCILRKGYSKRAAIACQAPDLFPAGSSKLTVPVECLCASNTSCVS